MATVQQIFDMAIHLMDEQNEDSGQTITQDTQEYKFRTISILNTVIPALAPYCENWRGRNDVPLIYPGNYQNPDMEQDIPLDDTLSFALLPFYLAGMLLSGENDELSAVFMNRYNTAFYDLRYKQPGEFEQITPVYGLF
jgi:hypothetical protein